LKAVRSDRKVRGEGEARHDDIAVRINLYTYAAVDLAGASQQRGKLKFRCCRCRRGIKLTDEAGQRNTDRADSDT